MKVTSTVLFLTAALGASAHPSGHAHKHAHRSMEEKRDFVIAKKPVTVTEYATEYAGAVATSAPAVVSEVPSSSSTSVAPEPTTSAAASQVSSAAPASSSSSSGSGSYTPFCGGKTRKRATAAEIAYKGNVGTDGDYGCNLMMVDNDVADKYEHTVTFTNSAKEDQTCVCWLKIGADDGINGFFKGNEVLSFDLPTSGKKVLAVDDDSQGGCACGAGSVPTTSFGEYAATWLEFDMANTSNDGWSGADASCLVAAALGLEIPGLKVCGHGTCSTINPGGTGTNAYLGGMEAEDGIGLNLAAGQVRLTVEVGYQG